MAKRWVGLLLLGAVFFAVALEALPELHKAWHHHSGQGHSDSCLTCLLQSGGADGAAPALVGAMGNWLDVATRAIFPSIESPAARELGCHLLEHAPPPAT